MKTTAALTVLGSAAGPSRTDMSPPLPFRRRSSAGAARREGGGRSGVNEGEGRIDEVLPLFTPTCFRGHIVSAPPAQPAEEPILADAHDAEQDAKNGEGPRFGITFWVSSAFGGS